MPKVFIEMKPGIIQLDFTWYSNATQASRLFSSAQSDKVLSKGTVSDVCSADWPKKDSANFESQNFEGP